MDEETPKKIEPQEQPDEAASSEPSSADSDLQAASQPPKSAHPSGKTRRFWLMAAGFLGWFVINGLVWLGLSGGIGPVSNGLAQGPGPDCLMLPLNLVVLFLLSRKASTRPVAGGILAAVGTNFLVSLILGLSLNAFCLIPFFN